MILHIGQETVLQEEDIIGIFDLDSTTVSRHTRKFLEKREKEGEVITVSYELPKSFIVAGKKNSRQAKVYISQLSAATLYKRTGVRELL